MRDSNIFDTMENRLKPRRLNIAPLTPRQLRLWLDDAPLLYREPGCSYCGEPLQGAFREAAAEQLRSAAVHSRNYIWYTFRFIILKPEKAAIGSAVFKDAPDGNGEVEIGYGLGEEYRGEGYMTETAGILCDWALTPKGVEHRVAETDLEGFASQRVLLRCGFREYCRNGTLKWRT